MTDKAAPQKVETVPAPQSPVGQPLFKVDTSPRLCSNCGVREDTTNSLGQGICRGPAYTCSQHQFVTLMVPNEAYAASQSSAQPIRDGENMNQCDSTRTVYCTYDTGHEGCCTWEQEVADLIVFKQIKERLRALRLNAAVSVVGSPLQIMDWIESQLVSVAPTTAQPKQPTEKCNQPAAPLIPRWGMSFACVLPKGHEGDHQQGGDCFVHGEYVGSQCPKWPKCPEEIGLEHDISSLAQQLKRQKEVEQELVEELRTLTTIAKDLDKFNFYREAIARAEAAIQKAEEK
jgi:hypothetical protein